ncbi:MAG TPA: phenylalanine--tRNA ligase subunit beta, partial [Candidatus Polarisedimenticolia bacterium]|nr:phenylalanine--tRNA ligase subunit beta [Candidatus Polarisedimenticolia bacterium]
RLMAVGLRPVNSVVDVTNYVLWEFGHPLHAFDLATLAGRQVRARRATRGEMLVTLDGVSRTLDPDVLVIADAERAVALAGIMGGAKTMVTAATTDLLIESAHFDAVSVRKSSKRLGLSTDASYRFERGADIEAANLAANRVAELIRQVAGGEILPGILEARTTPPAVRRVHLRAQRVASLLGCPVEPPSIVARLEALQFGVSIDGRSFDVEVPSHRQDIEREVDLIEEVGRSIGYASIPERLPHIPGSGAINRAGHRKERSIRRALSAAGCHEALTTSFAASAVDWGLRQRLDPGEPAIEPIALSNPLAADQEILRTTILPGLLAAVSHNLNRDRKDVRLFEIGKTFRRGPARPAPHADRKHPPAGEVEENVMLGIALTGGAREAGWVERQREVGFFDMKGVVESVITQIGFGARFEPLVASEALDPSSSALVSCDGVHVGRAGALTRDWREKLGLKQEVFVAEINLSSLFALPETRLTYRPLPRHPAVVRDLSLVVGRSVPYADLERCILSVSPELISKVSVFDRYLGDALPANTMGLSLSIVYRHPERTLASEEVADLQEKILKELSARFGVTLRS